MITILLADDHIIVRDGLTALLEAQGDMKVIAVAGNGREAVQIAQQTQPNLAIIDIAMPEMNGIEATRQIRTVSPSTHVVILSIYSTIEHVYQSFQAGAIGFLLKESAGTEVVQAIRTVASGQHYLSKKLAEKLPSDYFSQRHEKSPLESLSEREREVLQLTVEGNSATQTAKILSVSPKTVETYRCRLMQKLNVNDLPALVKFAIQHGLTPLE
jgi:DNA-binding NarL/FixJ family response regulator